LFNIQSSSDSTNVDVVNQTFVVDNFVVNFDVNVYVIAAYNFIAENVVSTSWYCRDFRELVSLISCY